jgi:phosphate transport system protein
MTTSEIRKSFATDLAILLGDLSTMADVVGRMLSQSIQALIKGDPSLAREVERMDDIVDRYNLDIESKSLHLLALQQPMARDLRTIAGALKIITDIERAGDYAVDISKAVERLAAQPPIKPIVDIPKMGAIVQEMLSETLTAFMTRDLNLVQQMIDHDEEVDQLYRKILSDLTAFIRQDTSITESAIDLIMVARYLERMADHITNIGERIHYMETGMLRELHKSSPSTS